jgi:lysophospholipase L1-like esterase
VLPHLKQALRHNTEATIVALGSSSTAGFHASNIAHTYPAVLQKELEKALPLSHVAVINRGVGGEDATEMLPRLEKDVLALGPAAVIWQVGANGAMRRMDPELFKSLVATGVERLRAAGVDVVLMDNQRAPAILASPEHARIDQALAEVAAQHGAVLFTRGRLMDQWQNEGSSYAQFISDDGVHHNDRGYACVAKALAASILEGLGPEPIGAVQSASAR